MSSSAIGSMISRFREAAPSSPATRSARRRDGRYPEFWWHEEEEDKDERESQAKRQTGEEEDATPSSLSIDQRIARDIQQFTATLSPVVRPLDRFLGEDTWAETRLTSDSGSSGQSMELDDYYKELMLEHQLMDDGHIEDDEEPHHHHHHGYYAPTTITPARPEGVDPSLNVNTVQAKITQSLQAALDPLVTESGYEVPQGGQTWSTTTRLEEELPPSAALIADRLESALGLINAEYTQGRDPDHRDDEGAQEEEDSTTMGTREEAEWSTLLKLHGVASMDEVDDILERLEERALQRQVDRSLTRSEDSCAYYAVPPMHPVLEELQGQMQEIQTHVRQRIEEIDKQEKSPLTNTVTEVDEIVPVVMPDAGEVGKANETICESLNLTMLKLRHSLNIDQKEAAEKEERQKKEQEREKKQRKRNEERMKQEAKEQEEIRAAKLRVMGATNMLDVLDNEVEMENELDGSHEAEAWLWSAHDPSRAAQCPPSFDHQESLARFDALVSAHQLRSNPAPLAREPARFPSKEYGTQTDPQMRSSGTNTEMRNQKTTGVSTESQAKGYNQFVGADHSTRSSSPHPEIRNPVGMDEARSQFSNQRGRSVKPIRTSPRLDAHNDSLGGISANLLDTIDAYREIREQRYEWLRRRPVPML